MSCEKCKHIIEHPDIPHILRKCDNCGRTLRVHEPSSDGLQCAEGESLVIPAGFLRLSLNPLKASGQLTRHGMQWYAREIFFGDFESNGSYSVLDELAALESQCENNLRGTKIEEALQKAESDDAEALKLALENEKHSLKYWSYLLLLCASSLREAIDKQDASASAWAMAGIERARSMILFKKYFEEVVYMGNAARRIIDILRIWDSNKGNKDEAFWQKTFRENSYALSQAFAAPLVLIEDSAYIGGMQVDRNDAKVVDFLFSSNSSKEAVLIEIKTPVAKLIGSAYRGTHRPSQELVGAVMQVLDYRRTFIRDFPGLPRDAEHQIETYLPKCVAVIGNGESELSDIKKRTAFENFRRNSNEVEIVTYDEVFKKLEIIASLFGLSRPKRDEETLP